MSQAAAMLFVPSVQSSGNDEEYNERSVETNVAPGLSPSMVEGGSLRVRYISGKASAGVTWNERGDIDLGLGDSPLPASVNDILSESVPDRPSKPRKPYGFKQHVIQLIMSMFMVMAVFGLVMALLGVCIFLIGVALPFEML